MSDNRRRQPKSNVASDGFDYSKPYEPKGPAASAAAESNASTSYQPGAPRRNQRPIAVLLGGLGRK